LKPGKGLASDATDVVRGRAASCIEPVAAVDTPALFIWDASSLLRIPKRRRINIAVVSLGPALIGL
jgi:hypothetical protein